MTADEALKPCPLCGSNDLQSETGPGIQNGPTRIYCNQCDAGAPIGSWQGRAQPASAEPVAFYWSSADGKHGPYFGTPTDEAVARSAASGAVPVCLYAHPPAPAVPDGWKLVLVEPTEGQIALLDPWFRPAAARELLTKVLAAAPKP